MVARYGEASLLLEHRLPSINGIAGSVLLVELDKATLDPAAA
jgi:hypothetical protein